MKKIIGIELIDSAVENCLKNLEINDLKNESEDNKKFIYIAGKCEDILPELSKTIQGGKIVAIVDPPRSGLHPDVVKAMRTCKGLDKIVYVSCNAVTMADNLF